MSKPKVLIRLLTTREQGLSGILSTVFFPSSSLNKVSPPSCPAVTVWICLGHQSLHTNLLSVPVFNRRSPLARVLRTTPAVFYGSFLSCSDLKSARPQPLASRDLTLAANVSTFDNLSIITCSIRQAKMSTHQEKYKRYQKVATEQHWKLGDYGTWFNMLQLDIDTVDNS